MNGGLCDETDTALLRDALIEIRDAQERAGQSLIELWDPDTGEFSEAGSLIEPRSDHGATLLSD